MQRPVEFKASPHRYGGFRFRALQCGLGGAVRLAALFGQTDLIGSVHGLMFRFKDGFWPFRVLPGQSPPNGVFKRNIDPFLAQSFATAFPFKSGETLQVDWLDRQFVLWRFIDHDQRGDESERQ